MKPRKLRNRIAAVASSLGVATLAAATGSGCRGGRTASAGLPTTPSFPTFDTYPSWLPANYQMSNVDHAEGSDTTLYMMQTISDLYAVSGLFPFGCQPTTSNAYCLTPAAYTVNTSGATAGTFSITIAGFSTASGIAFNASAASIQTTLSNATNGPAGTTVTGPSTGPGTYVITPAVASGHATPVVTADFSGLTGGTDTITPNSNPNNTQSDVNDNFASTEELQGINDVGSGNGQGELCGTLGTPNNTTVDYSRSSKPFGVAGCAGQELGYAKDSVPAVDFQFNINPESYGSPSGYLTNVDPQCSTAGQYPSYNNAGTKVCTAFPSGGIGPVAAGWLPGDSYSCTPNTSGLANPCSGTPFSDVDNTPIGGGGGASSAAYRLWCQHGSSATAGDSQITDWGQLTNLSSGQVPGQGTPIGVPIRIIGVNAGSGTAATFNNFTKAGSVSGNCTGTDQLQRGRRLAGRPSERPGARTREP